MFTTADIDTVTGGVVFAAESEKIGSVGQIYLDNLTNEPEWVTVRTGLFGSKETFVPLSNATVAGNDIHVNFSKSRVKDAPRVDADGALNPDEENELYRYYGLTNGAAYSDPHHSDVPVDGDAAGVVGVSFSGPTADTAVTRSEEQLRVGTRTEEAGRARLKKYVVTEEQTRRVPLTHEEVTIEREPITNADPSAATDGPQISDEEHEVILHAERPVVEKEVVPVERITLGAETVTEEQKVTETVRKEQVELDGDTGQAETR